MDYNFKKRFFTQKKKELCPKCGNILKERKRVNYTHGMKSKKMISFWGVCRSCGFQKPIHKEKGKTKFKKGKRKFNERRNK